MDGKDIRDAANNEMNELKALLMGSLNSTEAAEIKKGCKLIFSMYKGFVDAGFSGEQAMQLTMGLLKFGIDAALNGGK